MTTTNTAIRGLIFDMDGTLVDNMGFHTDSWGLWYASHGLPFDADDFLRTNAGRASDEVIGGLLPHLGSDARISEGDRREAMFRAAYQPAMAAMPGLEPFLGRWADAGGAMAVATAAPQENADMILDGLDLRRFFAGVMSPTMGYRGKPHPDLFLAAAETMRLSPAECLVFEDAPMGIEAARRAGMRAVAVTTTTSADALAADHVALAITRFDDPRLWTLLGLA
ncbi:HAD family hydrolase [Methylobrevis albus]|uniref:HAD family phosphatase n=1 Tax=Methylobrevis albus TaxID=2793297 RepID=A0A931HY30_9HYPH|nr:HAD family phosphatase [Methylobrevis albus]MBH0236492.1 HAD family phosphatase [Methylobrevis albus]